MSYNFLINATKNRIITELREVFSKHPYFNDLEILNKFPLKERIQEGIIIRNTTATRFALSADNFQGTVCSYVTFAKHKNSLSLSVEWVREDTCHLGERIVREDFSPQFSGFPQKNKEITLTEQFVKSNSDLTFGDSYKDVEVYVNNARVIPLFVDGKNKTILLPQAPISNSTVVVSYWSRNLAAPGVYQLEIVSGNPELSQYTFMLDALLEKEEVIFQKSTGTETSFELEYKPVFSGSLMLKENGIPREVDVDYVVDYASGIITFLKTPLRNSRVEAFYRVKGLSTGPFTIPTYNQANNTALPGVVIAFGRGVSVGDKHFIVINKEREITAQEYSGKWEMGVSVDVYAKDSHKIEEISDIATTHLLFHKKEELDAEGIYLVDVNFGGEAEEVYDEATNDLYYLGSVEYSLMTEWILHKPLLQTIEGFIITTEVFDEGALIMPGKNTNFEKIF